MPSVSLVMSVSELQSESGAISITTGSCSSSTAISLNHHARSTDKTCSTHFKDVQVDPLCSMLFRFLLFYMVSLHQPFNGTLADPGHPLPGSVIFSAHLLSPVCKRMLSFTSVLYQYGVCFVMASNEIHFFANDLSTRQIEKNMRNSISSKKKYAKTKKNLGLELWD